MVAAVEEVDKFPRRQLEEEEEEEQPVLVGQARGPLPGHLVDHLFIRLLLPARIIHQAAKAALAPWLFRQQISVARNLAAVVAGGVQRHPLLRVSVPARFGVEAVEAAVDTIVPRLRLSLVALVALQIVLWLAVAAQLAPMALRPLRGQTERMEIPLGVALAVVVAEQRSRLQQLAARVALVVLAAVEAVGVV